MVSSNKAGVIDIFVAKSAFCDRIKKEFYVLKNTVSGIMNGWMPEGKWNGKRKRYF